MGEGGDTSKVKYYRVFLLKLTNLLKLHAIQQQQQTRGGNTGRQNQIAGSDVMDQECGSAIGPDKSNKIKREYIFLNKIKNCTHFHRNSKQQERDSFSDNSGLPSTSRSSNRLGVSSFHLGKFRKLKGDSRRITLYYYDCPGVAETGDLFNIHRFKNH